MILRFNNNIHCEKCYNFVRKNRINLRPYTCIIALRDFCLRVYDASHLKVAKHRDSQATEHDKFSFEHSGSFHTLKINQGCIVIFDSALVHSGAPYESGSGPAYRFHFYALPNGQKLSTSPSKTSKSVTYCDLSDCDTCQRIKNDPLLKNALHRSKFLLLLYHYVILEYSFLFCSFLFCF